MFLKYACVNSYIFRNGRPVSIYKKETLSLFSKILNFLTHSMCVKTCLVFATIIIIMVKFNNFK